MIFTTTIHEGMEGAPKDREFLSLYFYGWDLTTWDRHPWNPTTPDGYWSNSATDRVQERSCRNHGACSYCRDNRTISDKRLSERLKEDERSA